MLYNFIEINLRCNGLIFFWYVLGFLVDERLTRVFGLFQTMSTAKNEIINVSWKNLLDQLSAEKLVQTLFIGRADIQRHQVYYVNINQLEDLLFLWQRKETFFIAYGKYKWLRIWIGWTYFDLITYRIFLHFSSIILWNT